MPHDRVFELERQSDSLGHLFSLLSEQLDRYLDEIKPDAVLVQGDTSSAFAAALAAFYRKIPVGHIEAGLRSHDFYNPFPEEKHRELIARLARWHFVPTLHADENLEHEGIHSARRQHVGNTIVDSVRWCERNMQKENMSLEHKYHIPAEWFACDRDECRIILVTAHRRESWDSGITKIARGVRDIVTACPEIRVIWPLHPNPIVVNAVHAVMSTLDKTCANRIRITTAMLYPEVLWLMQRTWLILTDSGGLQEEAVTLKVPVLVLREVTERPEVIEVHGGALIGKEPATIKQWVMDMRHNADLYRSLISSSNPFGDGHAGKNIADRLLTDMQDSIAQQSKAGG